MAKCGKDGTMNTPKVYIVGQRENTCVSGEKSVEGFLVCNKD